jgi:hypothetical protein
MGARPDFWQNVHDLAICLKAEGATVKERAENTAESWALLPATARTTIVQELRFLLAELPDVAAAILLPERGRVIFDDQSLQAPGDST